MMRCANCGAFIRPGDRFCSSCGEPIEAVDEDLYASEHRSPGMRDSIFDDAEYDEEDDGDIDEEDDSSEQVPRQYRTRKTRDSGRKPLYNEHVFRDSFMDKAEEGHHAFLVTVTVLLIIATLAVGGLFLYTFLRQRSSAGKRQTQTESTVTAVDEIVILSDGNTSGAGDSADAEGSAADDQNAADSGEQQADQNAGNAEDTSNNTPEDSAQQTERQTEKQTEKTASSAALDITVIEQIMAEESTAEQYGISIFDLNTNREYHAGASSEKMYATATITVPILYTAALQLDQGAVTLNDQITYVNSIGGRGEPYPSQREGYAYPLSYYLTTMLTYSDNNCINCLIDFFGLQNINNTCQAAGFTEVDLQRKIVADVTDGTENYVSASDLTQMVKELYNGKFVNIGRDFMRQYFRITPEDEYNTLIGQSDALPETVTLLNQNGRGDTRYAETALILDDTHAYVISVMSTGSYGYLYEDAFRHVSDYVYETLKDSQA